RIGFISDQRSEHGLLASGVLSLVKNILRLLLLFLSIRTVHAQSQSVDLLKRVMPIVWNLKYDCPAVAGGGRTAGNWNGRIDGTTLYDSVTALSDSISIYYGPQEMVGSWRLILF